MLRSKTKELSIYRRGNESLLYQAIGHLGMEGDLLNIRCTKEQVYERPTKVRVSHCHRTLVVVLFPLGVWWVRCQKGPILQSDV